jgi:DNA-binding transcriptional LysR family regulator
MIQLHRLEGFYRVAIAGGYTRAARDFPYPISQPGVYQQVRKVEDALGVRLFERVGRDRVALTSRGEALFDFCAPFFEQLPGVLRAISEGAVGGRLRVEVAPLEMRHVIPRWMGRLHRKHPEIEVHLEERDAPDVSRLLKGQVDLVVDHIPSPPEGVAVRTLATHHGFVVTPRDHAFARARSFRPALLQDTPLVAYAAGSPERALQHGALSAAGLAPVTTVSASSSDAILALVGAGLGFSVIPWPDRTGPRVAGVAARRVPGDAYRFPVSVAHRLRDPEDPQIARALSALPTR